MSFVTNKAFVIAVGIFVTVAISTGIIVVFSNVNVIYGNIDKLDVSLSSKFNKFDMYNNTELTGLDMINTARKYANDKSVKVINGTTGEQINITEKIENLRSKVEFHSKYLVKLTLEEEIGNNQGVNIITFYIK